MSDTTYYIYWSGPSKAATVTTSFERVKEKLNGGVFISTKDPLKAVKLSQGKRPDRSVIQKEMDRRRAESFAAFKKEGSAGRLARKNHGHK